MLVLSRTRDEVICIGDEITVCVVDIRGDKVRLGVNAPRTVSVHRKEVYDAIHSEGKPTIVPDKKEEFVQIPKALWDKLLALCPSVTEELQSCLSKDSKSGV